ncbi:37S ribosomal protein [Spathaspora sp. JA1]|nr:37S ribosomal protein [Spathaspora sp. JA1]
MRNRLLKHGGRSGILPKQRPIFKGPIRNPTAFELSQQEIEQGIVEDLEVPTHHGKPLQRIKPPAKVITVAERIKHVIDRAAERDSQLDTTNFTLDQKWKLKRDAIRREFLREAYLLEAKRLEDIDRRSREIRERKEEKKWLEEQEFLEQDRTNALSANIPSIENLLTKGMMRGRTSEENQLLKAKRTANRHAKELIQKENDANNLLDLYHAAGNFITTVEELDEAIHKAFDVDFAKFSIDETSVDTKLSTSNLAHLTVKMNESLITDQVLGEISGKPGLDQIKEILSGETEKTKKEVHIKLGV